MRPIQPPIVHRSQKMPIPTTGSRAAVMYDRKFSSEKRRAPEKAIGASVACSTAAILVIAPPKIDQTHSAHNSRVQARAFWLQLASGARMMRAGSSTVRAGCSIPSQLDATPTSAPHGLCTTLAVRSSGLSAGGRCPVYATRDSGERLAAAANGRLVKTQSPPARAASATQLNVSLRRSMAVRNTRNKRTHGKIRFQSTLPSSTTVSGIGGVRWIQDVSQEEAKPRLYCRNRPRAATSAAKFKGAATDLRPISGLFGQEFGERRRTYMGDAAGNSAQRRPRVGVRSKTLSAELVPFACNTGRRWSAGPACSGGRAVGEKAAVAEVGDRVDDRVGAIGVVVDILFPRAAGENEDRAIAHLHAAQNVRLHRVTDHDRLIGRQAQFFAGRPHHHGAGFADAERLASGGRFQERDDRAAAGPHALLRRTVRIEIGGDELGAFLDHADRRLEHLEVERPPFSNDHVVGVMIDNRVAVGVKGLQQAAFADDECGPVWFLLC